MCGPYALKVSLTLYICLSVCVYAKFASDRLKHTWPTSGPIFTRYLIEFVYLKLVLLEHRSLPSLCVFIAKLATTISCQTCAYTARAPVTRLKTFWCEFVMRRRRNSHAHHQHIEYYLNAICFVCGEQNLYWKAKNKCYTVICMYVCINQWTSKKSISIYTFVGYVNKSDKRTHTHICFTRAYEMFFLVDYSFQSEHGICRSCIYNSLPEYRSRFYDFIMIHFWECINSSHSSMVF